MMSQIESKEQNNFRSYSSDQLGSESLQTCNSMEVDGESINNNSSRPNKVPKEEGKVSQRFSHDKNAYVNLDKIIRENSNTQSRIEVENEVEVNETSTCPSKLKVGNRDDEGGSSSSSDESSSSNSSSSNHKIKKRRRRHSRSRSRKRRHSRSRSRSRSKSKRRHERETSRRHKSHSRRGRRSNSRRGERKHRRRHSRSLSKSPSSNTSEATIKKKNYYEERRRARNKSRSNSALRVMKLKNLENACGYYQRYYQRPHEDNDPKKPQLYWDGYQWVIRPNTLSEQDFDIIKPGRKVQIANVPLHLNIQVHLFKDFLINKTSEKNVISTKDVKDINNIIRGIELDYENNTAVIAMESTELAKRMVLLDGLILLGHTLRFSPYHDINTENKEVSSSNIAKASALANSAHLSAKSAAIAFAALKSLGNVGNKNEAVQLNLQGDIQNTMPSSKVLKVMNLVDAKESSKIKPERYEEIMDDIKDEFNKFGNVVSAVVIKPKNEKIGAEAGSVFVEFLETKFAENCIKGMKGKRYEGREIKLAFIDENVFKKEIL